VVTLSRGAASECSPGRKPGEAQCNNSQPQRGERVVLTHRLWRCLVAPSPSSLPAFGWRSALTLPHPFPLILSSRASATEQPRGACSERSRRGARTRRPCTYPMATAVQRSFSTYFQSRFPTKAACLERGGRAGDEMPALSPQKTKGGAPCPAFLKSVCPLPVGLLLRQVADEGQFPHLPLICLQ